MNYSKCRYIMILQSLIMLIDFVCVVFQVVLVRWNEPFQKLATCDADGGIFVWIQYEGRWSVELVNDRGAQVGSTLKILQMNVIYSIFTSLPQNSFAFYYFLSFCKLGLTFNYFGVYRFGVLSILSRKSVLKRQSFFLRRTKQQLHF